MATGTATAGKFATKVMVGPADVYLAPTGTAMPALPPTGILTPETPWLTTGETTDGVVFQYSRKVNDIRTETQSTPVDKTVTTSTVTVTLTFSQDTLLSMKWAYGGGTITKTAAVVGTAPGYSKLTLSPGLDKLALLLVGKNIEGLDRIIYIPKVVSVGKVKTSYLRAKSARAYPASFDALCTVATIPIIDITAATA